MAGRNRGPKYRRKLFVYFMAIAIVPLLILGIYSYRSATKAVRDSIRQSNETALIQVEGKAENVLNAVRQNFLQMASRSLTEELVEAEGGEVPYPKLRSFIDDFAGMRHTSTMWADTPSSTTKRAGSSATRGCARLTRWRTPSGWRS